MGGAQAHGNQRSVYTLMCKMLHYCTCSRLILLLFVILHLTCSKETDSHKQRVGDPKVPLTRPDCLRVDGVQYTSAVLHWKPHSSTRRLNYVILCTGTYYETLENGSISPAVDSLMFHVPMEVHQLALLNLKPNSSYSCVVETERIGVGRPCHFITNGQNVTVGSASNAKSTSRFQASHNHMTGSILLGGVLPMVLIAGCVGAILLARKFQNIMWKKEQLKNLKYQRINRTPAFGPSGVFPNSPLGSPASPHHMQHMVSPRLPPSAIRPGIANHAASTVPHPTTTTIPHAPSSCHSPNDDEVQSPQIGIERDMSYEFKMRGIVFRPPPPIDWK